MKTNRLFVLIFFSVIFTGCSPKPKKFIIEQQVINYIKNICKIESKNNILIIFLTGFTSECQPCEKGTIALVDSITRFKNSFDFLKYIIISDNNEDSYKYIRSDKFTVLSDRQYALQKHGINYPYNFIIEFDKSFKTIYWEALIPDNFNKIYEIYKNK